jgi:hypothetical protein
MNTSWYNTRAGREWRILMQDMTNTYPGKESERAEPFATAIGSFCGISPSVIIGWIKHEKIPSIENIERTIDIFTRMMRYRPSSAQIILEGTRNFKREIREKPYIDDKIERLNKYLRINPGLLEKLVEKYCDPPIVITARITAWDEKTNKYHVHFYNYKKSNTAFMRERMNYYNQIKNLLDSITVRNSISAHLNTKNWVLNLDLENSISEE